MTFYNRLWRYCDTTYGSAVEEGEDKFIICPECDEPLYDEDWTILDYFLGNVGSRKIYCPICENLIWDMEEDKE